MRPQSFQHIQVPTLWGLVRNSPCPREEIHIPRAAVLPRPHQDLQMPAPGESSARGRKLPLAAIRHGPDERREGLAKPRDANPPLVRAAAADGRHTRALYGGADRASQVLMRPSIARSRGSRRSSTSFWMRSGKSSSSARNGGREDSGALTPAAAPRCRHLPRRRTWWRHNALPRGKEPGFEPGVVPSAIPRRQVLGRPIAGLPPAPTPVPIRRDRGSASPTRPRRPPSRPHAGAGASTSTPCAGSGRHQFRAVEPTGESP